MTDLRVVGPAWLADDLHAVHDRGFEIVDPHADYWCSGAHYARLRASGIPIRFTTPGGMIPVAHAPYRLIQRHVRVMTLHSLADTALTRPMFIKPNDLKLTDSFPAAVTEPSDVRELADRILTEYSHMSTLPVAVSEPLTFTEEYRVIVIKGVVSLVTCYHDGEVWGREASGASFDEESVKSFAQDFVDYCERRYAMPQSYGVDIGRMDTGLAVIETNPASSSGWYSMEPTPEEASVITTSIRLGQHDPRGPEWSDPFIFLRTAPLPRG